MIRIKQTKRNLNDFWSSCRGISQCFLLLECLICEWHVNANDGWKWISLLAGEKATDGLETLQSTAGPGSANMSTVSNDTTEYFKCCYSSNLSVFTRQIWGKHSKTCTSFYAILLEVLSLSLKPGVYCCPAVLVMCHGNQSGSIWETAKFVSFSLLFNGKYGLI